jgi:hypothetical protein
MKKLIFTIILAFLLVFCKMPSDTTVVNNSSRTVSFLYSHTDKNTKTLNPNASISAEYFLSSIIILQPEKRVKQDRELYSSIITISDLPSWEIHVENKTDNLITLTANGWMDEMNVPVGDFVDLSEQKGIIYTNKPQFSVTSNTFPYDVQWQFRDNIFYVIIRD